MIIWIASYPKSGNTWLRSLLCSYFFTDDGKFNFNLLKNINSFPSVKDFKSYDDKFENPEDTAKYWIKEQEKINQSKKIKFLKTHNALCKINNYSFTNSQNTLGAIYLIRDPRNVITSLASHYQISKEEALQFMKDEKRGIVSKLNNRYVGFQPLFSWSLNHKSWVNNKSFPVHLVRYEDLELENHKTFIKILEFIKSLRKDMSAIDKDKARKCVENCSFDKLKKEEDIKGFPEAINKKGTNEKIKFFNLGNKNNYKVILNKKLLSQMNEIFKNEIKEYRY
tara:strand:- start:1229 stop:2071 length:843 start_codon:yes stop_codon:yes gene_type:complete